MKRGVCVLAILLVLLAPFVTAEPELTLEPTEFYETNEIDFELSINNFGNDYEIKSIQTNIEPLTAIALVDYKGWTETFNQSELLWSEGSVATNVMLAMFEYLALAPLVDEDTEATTTIILTDDENVEHEFTFSINILNDNTPPNISTFNPEDGDYIKEGITDELVQLNADDPETGIQIATFDYVICEPEVNTTPEEYTVVLDNENDTLYQNTVDFSMYENEESICFTYTALNNGGEVSTYEGEATVDGVPPVVNLVSPEDTALVGLIDDFSFIAEDNLADTLDCTMYIDDEAHLVTTATNGETMYIESADVEEGEHTWEITCLDAVGWEGSSEERAYTLDKTPPVIEMVSPENDSIISESTLLEFDVTDNYQLNYVAIVIGDNETEMEDSFVVDVSSWPDGPNEFAVVAVDYVGNEAEQTYRVVIDRTPPEVQLVSPDDNVTNDVHVDFSYTAEDNYDPELDCVLLIDDVEFSSMTTTEVTSVFNEILALGEHTWKIQCVDDAGNSDFSDLRTISIIDTSGPDITMDNPDVVFRGDLAQLSLTVTDISGVDSVTAFLVAPDDSTQAITLENDGDEYSGTFETSVNTSTDIYTLNVLALDTLNNSKEDSDEIEVTYKYFIELTLDPTDTTPNSELTVSGLVIYDDGTTAPESTVELALPENVTETVTMDAGMFSHIFTVPGTDGTYDVTATVTSEENNQTYTTSESFTVTTPAPVQTSNSGGGGGSSNYGGNTVDDYEYSSNCNTDWQCTAWTTCADSTQTRICIDYNKCSNDDSSRTEERSCTVIEEEAIDDGFGEDGQTGTGTTVNESVPVAEESEVDETEEDPGDSIGIGKAFGFLNLGKIGLANILFVILAVAMLLGLLYRYGWSHSKTAPQDVLGGKTKVDLEDYLNNIHNRRNR